MTDVLLLNATYEPLCVVTVRRAVVLVLAEKVDVLIDDERRVIRSARIEVASPLVVRLRSFVRVPYRTRGAVTRRGVLRRDDFHCAYCAGRGTTVDHVVPTSRGGANSWENVVACCAACNSRKGDRLLREIGWTLRRNPEAPLVTRRMVLAVARVDPEWEPWLALDRSGGEPQRLATQVA